MSMASLQSTRNSSCTPKLKSIIVIRCVQRVFAETQVSAPEGNVAGKGGIGGKRGKGNRRDLPKRH